MPARPNPGSRLEQQQEGTLLEDPQAVYSGGGEWEALRPWLDRVSLSKLAELSGLTPRMLRYLRNGDRKPSAKKFQAIVAALVSMLDGSEDS